MIDLPSLPRPDPEIVFSLAAVFWLHGWRRTNASAFIAVHLPLLGWRVRKPWMRIGPFALITWCPGLITSLILSPAATQATRRWQRDFAIEVTRGRRRLHRIRRIRATVQVLGTILVAWVVFGVPLGAALWGAAGLISALAALLPMLALVGAFTWLGLRALGCRGRKALLRVATVVGPFSAPFASEQLLRQALEGSSAPARAATLVGDKDFLDWIRPWAYDDRVGHDRGASAQEEAMSELLASLPAEVRDRAIGAIPSDGSAPAARFCPRCGGAYLETALACDACDGIQLLNTSERRVNERY